MKNFILKVVNFFDLDPQLEIDPQSTQVIKDHLGNIDRKNVPYSVFIEPPLSKVGLNEKEAKAAGVTKIFIFALPHFILKHH